MEDNFIDSNLFKNRKFKITTLLFIDLILIYLSYYLGFIFRFYYDDGLRDITLIYRGHIVRISIFAIIYILVFYMFKQYKSIWTLAGYDEFINGVIASIVAMSLNIGLSFVERNRIPFMVTILAGIMVMITCNGVRIFWRVCRRAFKYTELEKSRDVKNVKY